MSMARRLTHRAGDASRLALLLHVLLYLFVSTAGLLNFNAALVVGDTPRPVRGAEGVLRIEVMPPWMQGVPRSVLVDNTSQVALRWLVVRCPSVAPPNVWSGLRSPLVMRAL